MSRVGKFALVALGLVPACLQVVDDPVRIECAMSSDCNVGAGEVCDEGVCWGDPPAGMFAAVLGPPTSSQPVAAATEIPLLGFAPDGWFSDVRTGVLTLASTVRVSGRVRAACPPALASCSGFLTLGAQVRWSRPSALPGAARVTVPVASTGDGFELFLPRPDAPTTYTVAIVPSTDPLGPGLPAPAQFFPPQRFQVTINPADAEVGVTRDFELGATTRTINGRIARAGVQVAGWRVRAEVADGEVLGAFVLASNITPTTATGEFVLTLPEGPTVVDIVVEPPLPANRSDAALPSLRIRDHVVSSSLAPIDLPTIDRVVSVPVVVVGTTSNGDPVDVAAAIVSARLDQELSPGVFLRYEATTTTTRGVGSLPLYLGSGVLPLRYKLDVLPGPSAELASVYGVELALEDRVQAPPPILLPRRVAMVGQLLDEQGFPLADTTVSASVSSASLCKLSSEGLRAAKALAPSQDTTNARGEFTLWLDPDLAGTALTYDIAVEPSIGTWAPRWTFVDRPVDDAGVSLWLPPAAHVRAEVLAPGQILVPDTLVSIYERTAEAPPCQLAVGGTVAGGLELRAIGVSDDQGIVRLILPRFVAP